jgi:SPP1 gp7 family putative phage head morphogenesis protein
MSANDYLLDAGIKHQIYVQRYAGGQVKDLVKYLDDAQAEILRKLDGVDSLAESRSLQRKLDQIAALQSDALEKLSKGITDNAADFAEYEAEFAVKTMNTAAAASVTLPASEQLRALVTQAPMQLAISGKAGSTIQSLTLGQAATQFSKDKAAEITRTIQRGMVEGSTVQSLTRQIASVTNKHKRQAEALVRTSVNHISSEARSAVNRANDDILKGEEYVSVLDGRTTIGCAALDGKILGFDEPPFTPRHWNCRSLRVPVLQDRFQEEGLDGTRASMDGPVSAKRTYSGWLKGQSKEFRVQVLGKERAALFDAGKLSLDDFVDANGNPISLKQLQVLDGATNVRKTPKVVPKPTPGTGKIPGQAKKFVPAKTIAEAKQYAEETGLATLADYGKLDIEAANMINKSVQDTIERFPAMRGRMSFIGSMQKNVEMQYQAKLKANTDYINKKYPEKKYTADKILWLKKEVRREPIRKQTYAFARPKSQDKYFAHVDGVVLNEKFGSTAKIETLKQDLKSDAQAQWHPVGTENLQSIMDHEMGHQIDYLLDMRKSVAIRELYNSNLNNMKQDLSAYGKKNIAEFIAESWSEYVNNPTPRPLAKQVGDLINVEYAKKFGDK